MLGSGGLLKVLHYQSDGDLHLKRPYHYSTHFDHTGANGSVICEYAAARRPPISTGYWLSLAGMVGTGLICFLSRRQHEEKWWLANLFLVVGYCGSFKFHKAENGMTGHISGVWCAGIGAFFAIMRMYGRAGNQKWNLRLLFIYMLQGWIDWGRMHQWIEHTNEIKKNVVPLKRTVVTSMWGEFIPSHMEAELILLRPLKEVDD